jgi:hypothetical protein
MQNEVRYVTGMGDIALPGTRQQELGTGCRILLKDKDTATLRGNVDRTEQACRPSSDHCHIVPFHLLHLR